MRGAILVGGASSRMGRPKAGLMFQSRSLLEASVAVLRPYVQEVALVGHLPEGVEIDQRLELVDDVPGISGPLAGLVAALESDPEFDWIVLASDMPGMSGEAIEWLLENRSVTSPATVGLLPGANSPEPLPGIFCSSAASLIREFIRSGGTSLRGSLSHLKAQQVAIPEHLRRCWTNVNTPEEWNRFADQENHEANQGK